MEKESAIKKYEDLLLGVNPHFYLSGTAADKELAALAILRYAIEELLEWTPQEAMEGIPAHVAEQMHFPKLVDYIEYPKDVDDKTDYDYAVYKAFPNEVKYDARKKVIQLYNKLVLGERLKYPKNYFGEGRGGRFRARCILQYAIDKNISYEQNNPDYLFAMFSNRPAIKKMLKEWKIYSACKSLFDDNPILFLYETLERTNRTEFLYNFYSFNQVFNTFLEEKRK